MKIHVSMETKILLDSLGSFILEPRGLIVWEVRVQGTQLISAADDPSVSQSVFTIMERGPTQAFSWLKVPTCRGLLRDFEIFGILLTAFVSTSNCDSSFEYLAKPVYL